MISVSQTEVDRLATETMMLKEFLPKLLTPDVLGSLSLLTKREQGNLILLLPPSLPPSCPSSSLHTLPSISPRGVVSEERERSGGQGTGASQEEK